MQPLEEKRVLQRYRILANLYCEALENERQLQALEKKHNFNYDELRILVGNPGAGEWAANGVTSADRNNPRYREWVLVRSKNKNSSIVT